MRTATRTPCDRPCAGLCRADGIAAAHRAHRPWLLTRCRGMLGDPGAAEDAVQETFLRAWRRRETFEGRSTLRAWLYRIATNACLDLLAKRRPEPATGGEVRWLQPYPDALLDELAALVAEIVRRVPLCTTLGDDDAPVHARDVGAERVDLTDDVLDLLLDALAELGEAAVEVEAIPQVRHQQTEGARDVPHDLALQLLQLLLVHLVLCSRHR